MTFYEKFYNTFCPLVNRLWRIEVIGAENIPGGGAILASNHTSFADPIVISAAARRQVRYMAKKELFRTPLAPLIKVLGAYPVDRSGADVTSVKRTIGLVESGELVGIFPQGHRHPGKDPRETEIKHGVAMIAYRSGAPLVPVFIRTKGRRTRIFHKTEVIFGKPLSREDLGFSEGGRTEYAVAARILFDRICSLEEEGANA